MRCNKASRRTRTFVQGLERRLLMCAEHHGRFDLTTLGTTPALPQLDVVHRAETTTASGDATAATVPVSTVPVFNSRPGAVAKLYLDFNGDTTSAWGSYRPNTTPAFSQDGDTTTFSDAEQSAIQEIWARVSEKYSPFNINVTTVDPGNLTDRQTLKVVIGGDGAWLGASAGGVAYVGGFYNSASNIVFVFPDNLSDYPKYIAEAAAHESGHGFGLQHQSTWSGSTKTNEYNPGTSTAAPVMGNSYSAQRGLWWRGTSAVSSTSMQDDMAVIANSNNGFGYRADDRVNTTAGAFALTASGTAVSGNGVIENTLDKDYFTFETGAGTVSFTGSVVTGAMLDLKLELRDGSNNLLAVADGSSLGETLTAAVSGGTYYLVVASHGGYGDVGQYTLGGSVQPTVVVPGIAAPTGLIATGGNSVSLAWVDNATDETGYGVQRSADGGSNWVDVATLAADSTNYVDDTGTAGSTYAYRVSAYDATRLAYSNNAVATLAAAAPAVMTATAVSASRIDLAWTDVSGETAYRIDRSADGADWSTLATVGAGITLFQNTGLSELTTYFYRVIATNAGGDSAASPTAGATTPAAPVVPLAPDAPSALVATPLSRTTVRLNWVDGSTYETGFSIEMSTNGGSSWSIVAAASVDATTATIGNLKKRTSYVFRVRAYNDGGYSAYSNVASATTLNAPSALPPSPSALLSASRVPLDRSLLSVADDGL